MTMRNIIMIFFIPKIPEVQSTANQRLATFRLTRIPLINFQLGQKTLALDITSIFPVMKVDKVIKNIVYYINLANPLLSRIS